jgi:hypothetical protein
MTNKSSNPLDTALFGDYSKPMISLKSPSNHEVLYSTIDGIYSVMTQNIASYRWHISLGVFMKIVAVIGILFFLYCLVQVVAKWQHRNAIEKSIWIFVIAGGSWWCISAFL